MCTVNGTSCWLVCFLKHLLKEQLKRKLCKGEVVSLIKKSLFLSWNRRTKKTSIYVMFTFHIAAMEETGKNHMISHVKIHLNAQYVATRLFQCSAYRKTWYTKSSVIYAAKAMLVKRVDLYKRDTRNISVPQRILRHHPTRIWPFQDITLNIILN